MLIFDENSVLEKRPNNNLHRYPVSRATAKLRVPDAIQVAAALSVRCSTFLTNDRKIPRLFGLEVLQLRSYLSAQ
jgi:predicted nucleic acid-binding protein